MTIRKVILVGANGTLGPDVLQALLSAKTFTVTVLSRSSSKSKYPDSVNVIHVSDDFLIEELVPALRGQDAIIVTFAGSNSDLQIRLADAALQAGVRRFIPADFGSCDSSSPRALDLVPLYRAKQKVRLHLEQIAADGGTLSWTSLVCGHFFDYGLKSGLLQFDLSARKARIFDGGEIKWSATTLETIATATVRVLRKVEETRNRMLYVQSFCVTQNEVLRSLERVMGREGWQVEQVDSDMYIKEVKGKLDREPGNAKTTENLVSVVGIVDSNWEGKKDFANLVLGLQDEDLDQAVRKVIDK